MPDQFAPEGEALLKEVVVLLDEYTYPNEAEYERQAESGPGRLTHPVSSSRERHRSVLEPRCTTLSATSCSTRWRSTVTATSVWPRS